VIPDTGFYSSRDLGRYTLEESRFAPVELRSVEEAVFAAFEKAGFGTVELDLESRKGGERVAVHFGECLDGDGRILRDPPGTIRYRRTGIVLRPGRHRYRVEIPPDERNTGPGAILMPREIGEVIPFRYVEIEGYGGALDAGQVTQVMVHYAFDEEAASFSSSSEVLNAVWEMCRHSIKVTSFLGIYVDGDRERIPYEGDAYINQLCHYAVDTRYEMARRSHEYLLYHPTWPTEWCLHANLMAWADYMQTGDSTSIELHYELLKRKSLAFLARGDGLISTMEEDVSPEVFRQVSLERACEDVIDWPPAHFTEGNFGERDDYDMEARYKTVVNGFYYKNLQILGRMADVLGRPGEAAAYAAAAKRIYEAFNRVFFDEKQGRYVDGEGSAHCSLHGNMFPLAFGLVPEAHVKSVAAFVKSRGMACSVYGGQHLLEALYNAGEARHALHLMTATHDRSWWHMIEVGSTITLEAWDWKYKNNLDWNHAWGAAPLNIIARRLFGIRPGEPGFRRVCIAPQPADLEEASIRYPSPLGPIEMSFTTEGTQRRYRVDLPEGMQGRVRLPEKGEAEGVCEVGPGTHEFTCRSYSTT
jgi:hypothetical protein